MFLSNRLREIARKKQACLVRSEINRKTLALRMKNQVPKRDKTMALGLIMADFLYSLWRLR